MSKLSTAAKLALEDGTVFVGQSFGALGEATGEVVFNTSHFGYQEILTDPSYVGQIVVMAAVQIGNVGTNPLDDEAGNPHAAGLVVRQASRAPSSWRNEEDLGRYLIRGAIPGLEGIDTRQLVRHLRTHGSMRGALTSDNVSDAALIERARALPSLEGLDLVRPLSTKKVYEHRGGTVNYLDRSSRAQTADLHVVAFDYGAKKSMFDLMVDAGCKVTVVPCDTPAEQVLALAPDGVFLSNGPGDPAAVAGAQASVAGLVGKLPIFGICLGHQILALAIGGRTYKMKFGHRGANQPVKELATGKVEITSQNHGFAVDAESIRGRAIVTHLNLNDGTVEGLAIPDARAFSVQYHPEASPGPHDARHLFDRFVADLRVQR